MQGYKTDLDKNLAKKEKEVETLKHRIETMKTKHKKEVTSAFISKSFLNSIPMIVYYSFVQIKACIFAYL